MNTSTVYNTLRVTTGGHRMRNKRTYQGAVISGAGEAIASQIVRALDGSGRKSVRSTFCLSDSVIDDMNWLAERSKRNVKDIIDLCCEFGLAEASDEKIKAEICEHAALPLEENRSRKSIVLTRDNLGAITHFAKRNGLSRDRVLETWVTRFRALFGEAEKATRAKHEHALGLVESFWDYCEDLKYKLAASLGAENAIVYRVSLIAVEVMNLHNAIKSNIEEGSPIDPYRF
jgi:hypothetical protein